MGVKNTQQRVTGDTTKLRPVISSTRGKVRLPRNVCREKAGCPGAKFYSQNIRHGLSGTPTHNSWRAMMDRCRRHPDYVGRISVCAKWCSYKNFLEDMGERPVGKFLERKNNNKGYFLGNCCWATREEQNRNRRNNHFLALGDVTKTLAEWAEDLELSSSGLIRRLKSGQPLEVLLLTKKGELTGTQKLMKLDNETRSQSQWAASANMSSRALYDRLRKGLSLREALARPKRQGSPLVGSKTRKSKVTSVSGLFEASGSL